MLKLEELLFGQVKKDKNTKKRKKPVPSFLRIILMF